VPAAVAFAIQDIAVRAAGYGMPGVIADGQDVIAMHEATQAAVQRARAGAGPTLIEAKTYRFKPHYPIFDEERPREEIERWMQRDPIALLGQRLERDGLLDAAGMAALDRAIVDELNAAIAQAEATPMPAPDEVFQSVYAEDAREMGL
jgi:TPP-dependent pyruvate/acetoin dehydrogenase alpha subunit